MAIAGTAESKEPHNKLRDFSIPKKDQFFLDPEINH
jgi:hypothetical protein